MNQVLEHFNLASKKYVSASNKGLWKIVRNRETSAIQKLVLPVDSKATALDLGCGAGYYSTILKKLGFKKITCVDFSPEMLAQISSSDFIKIESNIETFKSDEKYDLILCAGALEFVDNPNQVFQNVKKMLNPGGAFVILVPNENLFSIFYKLYHRKHRIDVKIHSVDTLNQLAETSGLKLVKYIGVFPMTKVFRFE